MDMKNFKQSTILIGPKAVGKSLLTSKFEEQHPEAYVLNADLLINMIAHKLNGSMDLLESDKEFAEKVAKYKKDFDINNLSSYVYEMAKIMQYPNISDTSRQVILQFWKTRLLESALYKINQPVFVDASADFGACFNLSKEDQEEVKSFLYMHADTILSRHKSFLDQFGTIAHLKPGPTYHESKEERSHDTANMLFLSNPDSYSKFANITISAKDLFVPQHDIMVPNIEKANQLLSEIENHKNQSSFE